MQDLKIALLQFDQAWEKRQNNWAIVEGMLDGANAVDVFVLPEMFDTGFSMNTSLAEEWGEGNSSLIFLKKISKKYQSAIYTSVMCRDGLRFVNRGVFVRPDGEINIYDKRKSFGMGGEDQHYQSGSLESIVSYKGWNINLQICYDLRFPELSRNRIERNCPAYDVLIYVANWPEKRIEHWKVLLKARAIENQCFVVGVNRIGEDGNKYNYSGDSLIFNALGTALIQPNCVSQVMYSALNHKELVEVRTTLPFLKDR